MATRRVEGKNRLDFFALCISALGQTQTFALQQTVSALPQKADMTYDLTSSIVPRGTSCHRAVELAFPPMGFDPVWPNPNFHLSGGGVAMLMVARFGFGSDDGCGARAWRMSTRNLAA
jgi:hypothetical protein